MILRLPFMRACKQRVRKKAKLQVSLLVSELPLSPATEVHSIRQSYSPSGFSVLLQEGAVNPPAKLCS